MRKKNGIVISTKSKNTLIVEVNTKKMHSKYLKPLRVTKKFHVHTEDEKQYEEGQKIVIEECRPMSKLKRWKVQSSDKK